jgi:hypothetical protein
MKLLRMYIGHIYTVFPQCASEYAFWEQQTEKMTLNNIYSEMVSRWYESEYVTSNSKTKVLLIELMLNMTAHATFERFLSCVSSYM